MTREEYMSYAKSEIDSALTTTKNRLMNVVERAWAEGKKNAETDGVMEIVKEAIAKATAAPITSPTWPQTWYTTASNNTVPLGARMEDDGK